MSTFYLVVYFVVTLGFFLYVTAQIAAVLGALTAAITMRPWLVDPKNPLSKKSQRGAIRDMEAMDIVVVGRGGSPAFPVITQSARRVSTQGLQAKESMNRTSHGDWDVVAVDKDTEYRSTIQSAFGYLDPVYTFRSLVYRLTGKQVVRIWFPFYITGLYALYEPITMKFVRARAKGLSKEKGFQKTLDNLEGVSQYEIVEDVTDHMLWQFPLRTITESLPTKNGFSLRIDVTVFLQVTNALDLVSFKDWSSLVANKVSNAVSKVVRAGNLEQVYAVKEAINEEDYQTIAEDAKSEKKMGGSLIQAVIQEELEARKYQSKTQEKDKDKESKISLMELLGLSCQQVILNDLIPADKDTEKRIVEIMSIQIEGEKRAVAAGRNIQERIKALEGATPEQVNSLAAITAAQEAGKGGKIDWIIGANQGNVSFGDVMNRRTADSVSGTKGKGGE